LARKSDRPPVARQPHFENVLSDCRVPPALREALQCQVAMQQQHIRRRDRAADRKCWRLATSPLEIPWLTGLSSKTMIMLKQILKRDGTIALQVGNRWLRLPPKAASQKLIKNRATRAELLSC
jgi:hypothetical protein